MVLQVYVDKSIISKEDDFERTSYRTLQNSVIVRTNWNSERTVQNKLT